MKKFLGLVVISLILMTGIVSASELGELSVFAVPKSNLPNEDKVLVSIIAKNVEDIASVKLRLDYDSKVLQIKNIMPGDLVPNTEFFNSTDRNSIIIGLAKEGGFSAKEQAEGSIAKMEFKSIGGRGNIGMTSPLNITILEVLDSSNGNVLGTKINNGKYTVGESRIVGLEGGPGEGPGSRGPREQETTEQPADTTPVTTETLVPTETAKPTPGFGVIMAIGTILAISMRCLYRRR